MTDPNDTTVILYKKLCMGYTNLDGSVKVSQHEYLSLQGPAYNPKEPSHGLCVKCFDLYKEELPPLLFKGLPDHPDAKRGGLENEIALEEEIRNRIETRGIGKLTEITGSKT